MSNETSKKPCRACTDFSSWKKLGRTTSASKSSPPQNKECPPDREDLGRATWTFLHTMADHFPERPNLQQQHKAYTLLTNLADLYPCGECAEHLQVEVKNNPPDTRSRSLLSQWLCGVHNNVNVRLGKDAFDCSLLGDRWGEGPSDGSCD
ncbi:ERV/ALR sulfhydryl oxidase domain-containing protein [Piptocephalis cylindrospora]|uniref:Sulfhydryl oxidase n=1 Tax=Piptocephalis cylindrospora TaxID=1907219 RepID=A0A4P9Y8S1_9FUNG|nr:ERV/ALR sulfhydryl oxidase domain-containing protein [Piptocephalis cylindrospora]|eukprot:RKP14771.1 ERV/ALR sulfhydryl oxidase domain-containing protein [Piptocephalis cylindrospora]